ncbi:hypothetical protein L7F22_045565 [Adiantum nelumboides]|nr:hypothetical protein [Adiantum nelumboides]
MGLLSGRTGPLWRWHERCLRMLLCPDLIGLRRATQRYTSRTAPLLMLCRICPLFQAYYGRKPTVSHFRVFGCSAFVHIPKEKRQKLDFKSRKLLFLGYSAESDAYRLYDPDTRTTTVSRDVVFDESFITSAEGAAAQPIPILPPPSLLDPPASPVITPSTSHPVPLIQPPDVSPDHALSDSDSDLDVADAYPEVDSAPPRWEKRIPGWLYSTVASSGVTELSMPPPAGLPRCSARLQKRGQVNSYPTTVNFTAIGSGGNDFVQAMVGAVESVLQVPIPEDEVKLSMSSKGKYVSVRIGPVAVDSSDQVQAVYRAMKRDNRMKYFLTQCSTDMFNQSTLLQSFD